MRCPKCTTLILLPAAEAGSAGTVARCPRCNASWVTRPGNEAQEGSGRCGAPRPPSLVRRGPLTIDGAVTPASGPRRRWRAFGRAGLVATVAAMALALAATLTLSPGVSARPEAVQLEAGR